MDVDFVFQDIATCRVTTINVFYFPPLNGHSIFLSIPSERISAINIHVYCAAVDRDGIACSSTITSPYATTIDIFAHRASDGNLIAHDVVTAARLAAINSFCHRAVDSNDIIGYFTIFVEVVSPTDISRNLNGRIYCDLIVIGVASPIPPIISAMISV
ncbi:MAG: hypothetical protein II175_06315 [Schwartzia sp.]|nr:hypothetical protein [Schwartzia sp. (in: firmicutes)]